MGKLDFANNEVEFFFIVKLVKAFAFKQTKEHILIHVQPSKILNIIFLVLILGLQAKFSNNLRPKREQL